ncbi:MAG: hypothetical protein C4547_16545 [Phycisphaerales bacterium]|nr:MAG: hypothetical protein C4547_16545 [Phycisphaerales bacterium]
MHPDTLNSRRFNLLLTAGVAMLAASRLPQLLGRQLILDGDEAVVGLMARHLAEGGPPVVFFYGQRYGFALLEAGLGAAFFLAFGVSTAVLKAAVLSLWAVGAVLYVLAVGRWQGPRVALAAGALLVLCPAWGAWSMKARGGYVTAFAAAGLATWLIARVDAGAGRIRALLALLGVALGLILLAHPFWLIATGPLLLLPGLRRKAAGHWWFLVAGGVVLVAPLLVIGLYQSNGYWLPATFSRPDVVLALSELPYRVWAHFTGAYHITYRYNQGVRFSEICAALWCMLLLAAVWWRLRRRAGGDDAVARLSMLGVAGVAALSLVIDNEWYAFRYLLPISAALVVAVSADVKHFLEGGRGHRVAVRAGALLLLATGAASMVEFGRIPFNGYPSGGAVPEPQALRMLVDELLADGIHHVYVDDPLLQWNIMFESGEEILARWKAPGDRLAAYPRAVDAALRGGAPVAIVGVSARISMAELREFLRLAGHADLRPRIVADRYLVLPQVTVDLIEATEFELSASP